MKVLFATSELTPYVRVGGLAYAAAGLCQELHDLGVDITSTSEMERFSS